MVLKFLIYVLLFYFVFRFLFGGLLKIRVFNMHHHHYQPGAEPSKKPEGTITIDPKIEKNKKKGSDQIGEYVDFEEVK